MTEKTFRDNLFEVASPSDIPLAKFNEAMRRETFAGIRGIVTPAECEAGLHALAQRFKRSDDHPGIGEKPEMVRQNFQKLLVGGESRARRNDDARLFRQFYNPMWAEDIYGLRDVFIRLARVRNRIAGLAPDFATTGIEANGLWTAARVHQYPLGGGFFRGHTDYVASDVADEADTKFYQLFLVMTEKGRHFQKGGGFVDVGSTRINLEDHFRQGDILVYDGRTNHGVEDIDPHLPFDVDTFNGRVAAFVTLYKVM
jgi:hypothetical protein